MPRPSVSPFAERLFESLGPLTQYDGEGSAWVALHFCEAVARMFQPVEDLIRDREGMVGWGVAVDPDLVPPEGLAWLGQFVGVRLTGRLPGESDAVYYERSRLRVKETDGWDRGTRDGVKGAAREFLTGTRYVILNERQGGNAYRIAIRTKASETPDPDKVRAALLEQKPAGIILDYATFTTITYDVITAAYDSYAELPTIYATYADLLTQEPAPTT